MPWRVKNERSERTVTDQESGITLRGTRFLSDEQMGKLKSNVVIAAMLGLDDDGYPRGSALLTVTEVDESGKPLEPPAAG